MVDMADCCESDSATSRPTTLQPAGCLQRRHPTPAKQVSSTTLPTATINQADTLTASAHLRDLKLLAMDGKGAKTYYVLPPELLKPGSGLTVSSGSTMHAPSR